MLGQVRCQHRSSHASESARFVIFSNARQIGPRGTRVAAAQAAARSLAVTVAREVPHVSVAIVAQELTVGLSVRLFAGRAIGGGIDHALIARSYVS